MPRTNSTQSDISFLQTIETDETSEHSSGSEAFESQDQHVALGTHPAGTLKGSLKQPNKRSSLRSRDSESTPASDSPRSSMDPGPRFLNLRGWVASVLGPLTGRCVGVRDWGSPLYDYYVYLRDLQHHWHQARQQRNRHYVELVDIDGDDSSSQQSSMDLKGKYEPPSTILEEQLQREDEERKVAQELVRRSSVREELEEISEEIGQKITMANTRDLEDRITGG